MSSVVKAIQGKNNYYGLTAVTDKQIQNAQDKLSVCFASDYKEYIVEIGVASFDGHELTGICSSPRLNVVNVTEKCRKNIADVKPSWYVLEELNIDEITIWQDSDGSIYRVAPNTKPVKIANGIVDYINK